MAEKDRQYDADDKDDEVKEALDAFDLAVECESDNRKDALDDIRFARLGEQWPEKVKRERELDGRPCLTINKLPAIIRQVVNDGRLNKPAIVCHPVDDNADPDTAEIFNGLIRNIEQSSNADVAYDTALDFAVTGGFGYFRINTRYASDDSFDQDLAIEQISNPFTVYGDPYSTAADSADWNTAFIVDTMPKDLFAKQYKGADPVDWAAEGYDGLKSPWRDGDEVMVAEFWKREEVKKTILLMSDGQVLDEDVYKDQKALFDALGLTIVGQRDVRAHKVVQRVMSGCEVLETVNWAGKYIPIVPVYGEDLNVEGKRILRSLVRDAKDSQRNFNYWRTTATELVALAPKAPWVGAKGSFITDADNWATANTENHSYLEYDIVQGGQAPQRQPFAGIPAGALQEALNSSDDIKSITGLHDASLGARSNETSGVAINARQREGDVSTFHYIDNLSRAIRHAGRILIDLIPHVYSVPRIVRVLGPDNSSSEMKPINQSFQEPVMDEVTGKPKVGPDGQVQKIEKIYDLTTGKYDLTVSAGPSFTSRRQEAASQMMDLIKAFPAAAPVIGDLLAKNLDWPGADEVAERLHAMLPSQLQEGDSPEAQAAKEQMAKMAQMITQLQTEANQAQQDNAIEAGKLDVDRYKAETDRMKVANDTELERLRALVKGITGGLGLAA